MRFAFRGLRRDVRASVCLLSLLYPLNTSAGEMNVVSITPQPNAIGAPQNATITVTFDRPVSAGSITADSFWAFGRWSGTVAGAFTFSNGNQTVTLTPQRTFSAGETVMVLLSHHILSESGASLRESGYSCLFWVRAAPGGLDFEEIDVLSTRTVPNQTTRAYGGAASDLNGDGFLDLAIVNEVTADIRVFLNSADGSGQFGPLLQPPSPVNEQASPNEPADFNHDGHVDLCVANISTGTVSVLLGQGDGTFAPQQEIAVGSNPRGIVVLDGDGDGDIDIVNTNSGSGNLSFLENDGTGVFGSSVFFEGGGSGEWALAAADMNEDGVLDLVVGTNSGQQVLVSLGNGDGTFTHVSTRQSVGAVWMLVCGDLNGDGHVDVATANGFSDDGSILFGDGAGGLSRPQTYVPDPFPLATDVGDLDGDGDLDWILSSFGGNWRLYTNDGDGQFSAAMGFPSPDAASCALVMDFDGDEDLDLALIDELEDVVILYRQRGEPMAPEFVRGDVDGNGFLTLIDGLEVLEFLFLEGEIACEDAADSDDDGVLILGDPLHILAHLFTLGPPPAPPWPKCGPDSNVADRLGCLGRYPACP